MKFEFEQIHHNLWTCIDSDSYDGAPDSLSREMGSGSTKTLALLDLISQFVDKDILPYSCNITGQLIYLFEDEEHGTIAVNEHLKDEALKCGVEPYESCWLHEDMSLLGDDYFEIQAND